MIINTQIIRISISNENKNKPAVKGRQHNAAPAYSFPPLFLLQVSLPPQLSPTQHYWLQVLEEPQILS